MANPLQVVAGVGFVVSPIYDFPMILMMSFVHNPALCKIWLEKSTSASALDNFSAKVMSFSRTHPCAPIDPAVMNGLFIFVGLGLLIWWAYPFLKGLFANG